MNYAKITAIGVAWLLGGTSLVAGAQPVPPGPGGYGGVNRGPAVAQPVHPAGKVPVPHAHQSRPMHGSVGTGAQPMHPHAMPPGSVGHMGVGPQYNAGAGARIPPHQRAPHYAVNDWRKHGLQAPPRGHQWVKNGTGYMLVAIATGVVAQWVWGR